MAKANGKLKATNGTLKKFNGVIKLDVRDSKVDWDAYEAPSAPEGYRQGLLATIRWTNQHVYFG